MKKKISLLIISTSILFQSSFIYSASPKSITKYLAENIEKIITNVDVKYKTETKDDFTYLSEMSFGINSKLLKTAIKKLPTTKPLKGMKLNKYSLSKIHAEKDQLRIDIWAKGKYAPSSFLDFKVAFKIRFYLKVSQSEKLIRLYKFSIVKTKIGSGLPIPTKTLSKKILKSYVKEKKVDATELFDKMNAYNITWQGFSIEDSYIYFNARAENPFKISKNIEEAFKLLKEGKTTESLSVYKAGLE